MAQEISLDGLNKDSINKMREMHLYGMLNEFKASLENFNRDNMTNDKFLNLLLTSEYDERYNHQVRNLIKSANFRYPASLEEIDYSFDRGLDRNIVERLADMQFVKDHRNILITGSTGTGKTYLACAIGNTACQKGLRVIYANTQRLLGQLKTARANGTVLKEYKKISRAAILILEDFALTPFDNVTRAILMDIIDDRDTNDKCTILSSQLPVESWYEAIGEPTVADAIMDRITPNAIRFELFGESMRRRRSLKE